jgi:hypothetical protein
MSFAGMGLQIAGVHKFVSVADAVTAVKLDGGKSLTSIEAKLCRPATK